MKHPLLEEIAFPLAFGELASAFLENYVSTLPGAVALQGGINFLTIYS